MHDVVRESDTSLQLIEQLLIIYYYWDVSYFVYNKFNDQKLIDFLFLCTFAPISLFLELGAKWGKRIVRTNRRKNCFCEASVNCSKGGWVASAISLIKYFDWIDLLWTRTCWERITGQPGFKQNSCETRYRGSSNTFFRMYISSAYLCTIELIFLVSVK